MEVGAVMRASRFNPGFVEIERRRSVVLNSEWLPASHEAFRTPRPDKIRHAQPTSKNGRRS
jgi:hypothetical protein